ncbi:hypothetical protein niasHS_012204 [Heterodera schachtii]|uniref:DNA polymerase epsilon catalytic subunit n=1 Tax=Heterodera schachtii TaxID=97005 RepID=A0ABD2IMQ3_HETSC
MCCSSGSSPEYVLLHEHLTAVGADDDEAEDEVMDGLRPTAYFVDDGALQHFVGIREYDLPFDMCVCIDQQFFFGQYHTTLGHNPSTKLPSICHVEALVDPSEPFYAIDIETTTPLKFPNVEAVESGVFRADFKCRFKLNLGALAQIVYVVRPTMGHDELRNEDKIAGIGAGMADFDAVSVQIEAALLQALIERPLRTELSRIYHLLNVGAMFPNIILTNLLEEVCMSFIHNAPEANCKRPLNWRGQIEFCRSVFKRLHDTEEVQQQLTIRENPSLYTYTDEPTNRYKYKQILKICITRAVHSFFTMSKDYSQRTLDSGKTTMFAFVKSNCDENSMRLHFETLRKFLILHGVDGLQSVAYPCTVQTFKDSFCAQFPLLSPQLKEHLGLFLNYFIVSLNAQIDATQSLLAPDVAKMLENFKAGKPLEKISDDPSQYADVGLHTVHDGKLRSAEKKLFAFVDTCCTNDALRFHIDTLAKSLGKSVSATRSDGLESGALLSPSVFKEAMAQLIAEHCASEEKADSFGNFLDTFVCSLLGQSQWAFVCSLIGQSQWLSQSQWSFVCSFIGQQSQWLNKKTFYAFLARFVHEHQGSSGGPSSSNLTVVQQQKELSGASGVPPAQLGQKRESTAEQSQKTAKKGKRENQ